MRKTRRRKRLAAAAATAKSSIRSSASRRPDWRAASRRRVAMGTAAAPPWNPAFMTRESSSSAAAPTPGAEGRASTRSPRPQRRCGKAGIRQRRIDVKTLGKRCRGAGRRPRGPRGRVRGPRWRPLRDGPARPLLPRRSRAAPTRGETPGAESSSHRSRASPTPLEPAGTLARRKLEVRRARFCRTSPKLGPHVTPGPCPAGSQRGEGSINDIYPES